MARIRTIKPEFFTSEQIVGCSRDARLLFVGLWVFSDDAGRHPASMKRVKMEIFPGDDCQDDDVSVWIDELIAAGLLIEYEVQGQLYWQVTGWHHQKVDRPTVKFPTSDSTNIRRTFEDFATSVPPRRVRESKGCKENVSKKKHLSSSDDVPVEIENVSAPSSVGEYQAVLAEWNMLGKPFSLCRRLTKSRNQKLRVRLADADWREHWRDALAALPHSSFASGENKTGWVANFDWFIRPDTVTKILEGQYGSGNGSAAKSKVPSDDDLANYSPY